MIAVLLLTSTLAFAQEKRDENEVVFAGEKDPDMIAAIRQARSELGNFLALAAAPPAGTSGYKLKVMVKDRSITEHFWVVPFKVEGTGFVGVLANEPKLVKNVKAGQVVRFTRNEISDWGYVKNGRQVGSYTVCALFKKMPKDQADYYRKNHGFDC